jgi:hypothetical protein
MTKEWHCGITVTGASSSEYLSRKPSHIIYLLFPQKEGGLLAIKEMTLL